MAFELNSARLEEGFTIWHEFCSRPVGDPHPESVNLVFSSLEEKLTVEENYCHQLFNRGYHRKYDPKTLFLANTSCQGLFF